MRALPDLGYTPFGLDILPGAFTHHVGSICDRASVRDLLAGNDAVLHAATLHKPHVATHSKQDFIDVNVSGTLTLLEEAARAGVTRFIFSSTTSAFGAALTPAPDAPAAWIDEDVKGVPKNIYGATKTAAEDLCTLFARTTEMACLVLRLSRFFPEEDDNAATRTAFQDANAKANEFLYRRVDLEDAVTAHHAALQHAPGLRQGTFIISATTPFEPGDLSDLRRDPVGVVRRYLPDIDEVYGKLGFRMFSEIERVYVNALARHRLGWQPRYDFKTVVRQLSDGAPIGSDLARVVGSKGYHAQSFEDGPYPLA